VKIVPEQIIHPPVRVAARFNTPDWALKPPYPAEKRQLEQEATLKLRLSIDDRGRVIAVEPLGSVDPVFLAAARKHLIAKWRYRPATEDGRAVHSSTVVTLRFELEA
jgi:protein TonB